jgi:hypothetical protein
MRERALLSSALIGYFIVGYFGIGWIAADPARARSLATPLDDAIPFVLGTVVVYWSILPMALLPIFTVRDPLLFWRVALAYAAAISVSLAVFIAFPVTCSGFRVPVESVAASGFSGWLLRLLYTLDPPLNLFPSLHLALATLSALAVRRVDRTVGTVALVWTGCIAVSVCTVKQHFVADALAGIALGALAYAAIVARRSVARGKDASFAGAGLARYAVLVALFYAGLYAAYAVGVEPWTWPIG